MGSNDACRLMVGNRLVDSRLVSGQIVCSECGSASLVASGVFEHGTWIQRLTCWTCRDCQTVVAVPESDIRMSAETAPDAPTTG